MRKAIVTLGRQPGSEVIVLSPLIHVQQDGSTIPLEECKYVWVDSVIKRVGVVPNGVKCTKALPICAENPLDMLL